MKFLVRIKTCLAVAYHMICVTIQSIRGVWRVMGLPKPMISVFGGHRLQPESAYGRLANNLAQMFIDSGVSVITGGGSGIMEAAARSSSKEKHKGRTMGISIKGLEDRNPYVQEYLQFDYLFARKWLLTYYSQAYVIFPGGYGTLDELAEILTSMQTKMIEQRPIVLIGVEYWRHFMEWVEHSALKEQFILAQEAEWLVMTDDVMKAYEVVCIACGKPPVKAV